MGVTIDVIVFEPYHVNKLTHPFIPFRLAGYQLMKRQRCADDFADWLARIERGVGVLKDHLHFAPIRCKRLLVHLGNILPIINDLAFSGLIKL